jgi:two-component system, chemotaxis family, protein-glutamate methylesterase/glutaminase
MLRKELEIGVRWEAGGMQGHDIVVIGFSAGGIEPLLELVADLPADLPAAVFVVHHFPAHSVSALPAIVARVSELPVRTATDREPVTSGRIYVGRPDCHLLLMPGIMRLTRGPREHGNRPALDPLFRSAARSYASRVIGVILSGTLDDGTVGLHAIKSAGGITVVQDPEQAAYPGMPKSAVDHVEVDHVAAAGELGGLLTRLTREPALPPAVVSGGVHQDLDPDQPEPAVVGTASLRTATLPGIPSTLTCPECGGLLFEEEKVGLLHFRCHVGHAFSEETLMAVQAPGPRGRAVGGRAGTGGKGGARPALGGAGPGPRLEQVGGALRARGPRCRAGLEHDP